MLLLQVQPPPPPLSHKENLTGLDIDIFTILYVGVIDKMVKNLRTHTCALEFDSHFISTIL